MADVAFNVTPATPQKRPYLNEESMKYDANSAINSNTTRTAFETTPREASPALSSASSLTELTNIDAVTTAVDVTSMPERPNKKAKLISPEKAAERAAKQREKDEKARLKAEERARKDEERRRLNEEKEAAKRTKELEKAQKQKAKDAEKKEKEAKKQAEQQKRDAKEAERLKKERTQMRLGAFFGKPKPEADRPNTPDNASEGGLSRRSSVVSINVEKPSLDTKPANRPANPEFEKFILPFYVPEHTKVAPQNRFKSEDTLSLEDTHDSPSTILIFRDRFSRPRKRTRRTVPVKEIMRNMQASAVEVIDIDNTAGEALNSAAYKCLQFREDVRPPYQGTYTRLVSPQMSRKLSRNPFTRGLPDTNYDYDSEAEWEPPGDDDEDLENDDELSDAEDNEEEMADFLDDADDVGRRKGPVVDMEPVSSGLCWAGEAFDDNGMNVHQYRMDVLHDSTNFPINPYSSNHWADDVKPKANDKSDTKTTSMPPPRPILSSLSPNAGLLMKQERGVDGKPLLIQQNGAASSKKQLKLIEPEFMSAFKQAVAGSDMTKAGLIEVLKKQFPKCSKDAIKDTLGCIATRVGKRESEKKWQLIEGT